MGDLNTQHEVTPYSEVYGIHPRKLEVKTVGSLIVLAERGHEADSSDEEDEGDLSRAWFRGCCHRCAAAILPSRVLWPVLAVFCFLLRALGLRACWEAVDAVAGPVS